MPTVELAEQVLDTRRGERLALIAIPQRNIELGRHKLDELAAQTGMSELDRIMVEQIAAWPRQPSAFIFSAVAPSVRWHFDDGLDAQQVADLGYHLVRTQHYFYFGLLEAGISICYGAAFGERELDACQRGTKRLIADQERDRPLYHAEEGARRDAGLWLLRHLTSFTDKSYAELLEKELPDRLPLCETRADQVRQQLADLPG